MGIGILVLKSLYLILPAYIANMAPVLFKGVLKPLARPIAPNIKLRGKPLFGSHKTYMGLIIAALAGILVFMLQVWLFNYSLFQQISLVNYDLFFQRYNILPGFLLGFGAILGDLVKSVIKRQLGIKPGGRFMPWDQLDFLIGALVFISIIYVPSWQIVLVLFVLTPILHIAINHLGYYLNIKEVKW